MTVSGTKLTWPEKVVLLARWTLSVLVALEGSGEASVIVTIAQRHIMKRARRDMSYQEKCRA
jgi:hypothetical protein